MNARQTPKAIFLDMDGTILNHYNEVSEKTKEVVARMREKGFYVFIATGRGQGEIYPLLPEGFEVDGIISSNGMTGYIGEEKVFEHSLPLPLVKKIIEKAQEQQVYYELFPASGERIVLKQDQSLLEKEVEDPKPESVGINEWLSRKKALEHEIDWVEEIKPYTYSKFYCFAKDQDHIVHWQKTLDQMKPWIDFTTSSSSKHNVEIMVAGITKASGIQSFLEHLNLSKNDILAIGDSYNDLTMFELAGQAVAMKNAPADIQTMVDDVTTFTCDNDGVYHYLMDRFFPEESVRKTNHSK